MTEADGPTLVAPEGIDRKDVEAWFLTNVADVRLPLSFKKIIGGRSNLTYEVRDAGDLRLVLRRPPLGERLGSAHDMSREHKVVSGLAGTPVPVPPIRGFSPGGSPDDAPFYVMDFIDGPVLRTPTDAGIFSEDKRRLISQRVVDTLADLHSVAPDEVGLGDLGGKQNHVSRTLRRWMGQWKKSKTRDLPLVDQVHRHLTAWTPSQQGPATIVHGDYRLDNVILDSSGRIAAVLDWELCTLGDPLTDVGLLLVYWAEPTDQLLPLFESATTAPGFISREEVKQHYAARSGYDLSEIDYYVALGYWKLAIILEGVFARYAAGQHGSDGIDDEEVKALPETVERLVETASGLLD